MNPHQQHATPGSMPPPPPPPIMPSPPGTFPQTAPSPPVFSGEPIPTTLLVTPSTTAVEPCTPGNQNAPVESAHEDYSSVQEPQRDLSAMDIIRKSLEEKEKAKNKPAMMIVMVALIIMIVLVVAGLIWYIAGS